MRYRLSMDMSESQLAQWRTNMLEAGGMWYVNVDCAIDDYRRAIIENEPYESARWLTFAYKSLHDAATAEADSGEAGKFDFAVQECFARFKAEYALLMGARLDAHDARYRAKLANHKNEVDDKSVILMDAMNAFEDWEHDFGSSPIGARIQEILNRWRALSDAE